MLAMMKHLCYLQVTYCGRGETSKYEPRVNNNNKNKLGGMFKNLLSIAQINMIKVRTSGKLNHECMKIWIQELLLSQSPPMQLWRTLVRWFSSDYFLLWASDFWHWCCVWVPGSCLYLLGLRWLFWSPAFHALFYKAMDNPVCGKRTPKASVLAAKMNFKKMARLKLKVKGGEKKWTTQGHLDQPSRR